MTKKKNFIISGLVFMVIIVCGAWLFCMNKASVRQDLIIVFNKTGNISEYKTSGFSRPEGGHTWTNSEEASIDIPLPKVSENEFFTVSLEGGPFVAKKIKKQDVSVFVNDEFVKEFTMTGNGVYKFNLPYGLQGQNNVANIKFKISNPISPKELKISEDVRKLGMGVRRMIVSVHDKNNPNSFATYKPGDKINFVSGGNSSLYAASGWSGSETNLTWTDGTDAYVNLFVKDAKGKSLRLIVNGNGAFNPADKFQAVTVYVNDKELTTWNAGGAVEDFSVMIPSELIETGVVQIRFHIAKPYSPKTDKRKLGLAVRSIELSNQYGAKTKSRVGAWLKSKVSKKTDTATTEQAK